MTETVVVVGASMAGFRAAESLRKNGFRGRIVIVGDESARPYDRPPLSKGFLQGTADEASLELRTSMKGGTDALGLEWELNHRATSLRLASREITIDDGRVIGFDGLVIATGAAPRVPPSWAGRDGVAVLRSLGDAQEIRRQVEMGLERIVVVGAGFIGAEVSATARGLGIEVVLVEALAGPLERVVGSQIAAVCADIHRSQGVDLRTSTSVTNLVTSLDGRVAGVALSDGSRIECDLVVVGIGAVPNTDWLDDSGLEIRDGVVCDSTCLAAPGVVAAGDVARWWNPIFAQDMRVEHWDNALAMGTHAALTLLADLRGESGVPFEVVPWVWSDQYDTRLHMVGVPRPGSEIRVVGGALDDHKFVALFEDQGRVTAAFGMNMAGATMRWRSRIAAGVMWDEVLTYVTPG